MVHIAILTPDALRLVVFLDENIAVNVAAGRESSNGSTDAGRRGVRRLHLGIDTGGTFTDAALLDAATHEVVATAKSLTTKHDLARGVVRSIETAVACLPPGFMVTDIAMVSVSTTLATNAVVEGHGDPVAAFFIGFDDAMVTRTGVGAGLSDVAIIRISGGHDHAGREREPLDIEAIRAAVRAMDPSIRALAVCAAFATDFAIVVRGADFHDFLVENCLDGLLDFELIGSAIYFEDDLVVALLEHGGFFAEADFFDDLVDVFHGRRYLEN